MTGYEYTPWIWPMLASATFIGAVGLYLWRRRETPGALPLALAAFVMSLWCLANAAEIAATDFGTQQLWFVCRDALGLPGAIMAFWFALEYAGFGRLLTRPVVALLVGSVIVHAPLYVIDGGRLLWTEFWWHGGIRADLNLVGAAFSAYGFGVFLLAMAVFVVLFVRSPAHRLPVALILLGQVAIRAAYPLGALNIAYLPNLPLIILAFDFATLMYVIALFRFRLFDLVPVARETIIERMPGALLVLDVSDRIADLNRAAKLLFEVTRSQALGRPVGTLPGASADLARLLAEPANGQGKVPVGGGEAQRWFHVSTTLLVDWHRLPIGRLVLFDDITDSKRAEEQLLEQERALAAVQERERMARELHDSIGQVLGYVSMQADATRKLLVDGRAAEAGGQLARLAEVAREAHADVRACIQELHDVPSTQRPFLDALRREVDAFAQNYGVPVELTIHSALDATAPGQTEQAQLLRIVLEALTNARRHAAARQVRITLDAEDSRARIVIEDDGRGFDPAAVSADNNGRYGLRFMRERVEQLHGELEILSAPGRGTRLVVRVPLHPGNSTMGGPGRMAAPVERATRSP